MEKIYIVSIQTLLLNSKIYADVICYYYNKNKTIWEKMVIRISNIWSSFMIMYPPPFIDKKIIDDCIKRFNKKDEIKYFIRKYKEGSLYSFDKELEYLEIYSNNTRILKDLYNALTYALSYEYYCKNIFNEDDKPSKEDFDNLLYNDKQKIIDKNLKSLSKNDKDFNSLLLRYIETPFRFISNSLSINSVKYYLSCKYNIPLIGWAEILLDNKDPSIPITYIHHNYNHFCLDGYPINDFSPNYNSNYIIQSNNIEKIPLKIISYDIETYSYDKSRKGVPLWNYLSDEIIAIGIGEFHIDDIKPTKKLCFITHEISIPKNIKSTRQDNVITVIENNTNYIYIVCDNEKDLIEKFIQYLLDIKPDVICTFNGYGYDDPYVYYRSGLNKPDDKNFATNYNLYIKMRQAYTVYDYNQFDKYMKYIYPEFKSFELKIDGMRDTDNKTIKSEFCISADVYKLILRSDPKRFSQFGRSNLNTMLQIYKIVDPFISNQNSNVIAQKSGLSIEMMNKYWIEGTNEQKYEIAKYCLQDAYITGCLFIAKGYLYDYIEKSIASCTTLSDSFFVADGKRVNKVLINYAYKYNFAIMDIPPSNRIDKLDDDNTIEKIIHFKFGTKTFNTNAIKGGAVKSLWPGKHKYVIALDFSSMYPSQKEGSNIDNTTLVPKEILDNYKNYGFIKKIKINDYSPYFITEKQPRYILINSNNKKYLIEQYTATYILSDSIEEQKELYFVQNYSDQNIDFNTFKENSNDDRKSLKGIMLFDLRQLRNNAKKELAKFKQIISNTDKNKYDSMELEHYKRECIRFKAKELSYKILSNSEYGAAGSKYFSHYDPDIAACVTDSSRRLISFLKYILETGIYLIGEDDLIEIFHKNYINNFIIYEEINNDDNIIIDSYIPKTWIFINNYKNNKKYYKLILPKSKVIYQDTDSNYYINDFIVQYIKTKYNNCDQEILDNHIMNAMFEYNELIAYLCKNIINRNPINVGFEGAFIVARYFNVKKKYYGYKWEPNMNIKLYQNKYYFDINIKDIINSDIDLIDYINSKGVKITGIDLARRDQYRYINLFHISILHEDLSIDNDSDELLINIIIEMIKDFRFELFLTNNYSLLLFVKNIKLKYLSSRYIKAKNLDSEKDKQNDEDKKDLFIKNIAYHIRNKLIKKIDKLKEIRNKDNTIINEINKLTQMLPTINQSFGYVIYGDAYNNGINISELAEIYDQDDKNWKSKLNFVYYISSLMAAITPYIINEYISIIDRKFNNEKDEIEHIKKIIKDIFYSYFISKNKKYYNNMIYYKENLYNITLNNFNLLYNILDQENLYNLNDKIISSDIYKKYLYGNTLEDLKDNSDLRYELIRILKNEYLELSKPYRYLLYLNAFLKYNRFTIFSKEKYNENEKLLFKMQLELLIEIDKIQLSPSQLHEYLTPSSIQTYYEEKIDLICNEYALKKKIYICSYYKTTCIILKDQKEENPDICLIKLISYLSQIH